VSLALPRAGGAAPSPRRPPPRAPPGRGGAAPPPPAQAKGLALAEAARAKGLAEAEAIKARAAALAENQEAVVAQQLAEKWPEIVQAGAGAFGSVDHMVLLNGADGMSDMFAKALTMGGTGLGLARQLLSTMSQSDPAEPAPQVNGAAPATPPAPRKQRIPVTGDQEGGSPS
ncbi:flotillin domain-containing protein, partial [Streptomyces sp. NPDC059802]|uniref:flotillin domain-containing protein n=1 Tax=Streptomyces sp. NPDC059802 TaxID=3346952 RepID=UPI0036621893